MTIERDGQDREVVCDDCETTELFLNTSMEEVVADIKAHGWLITKSDGEWMHFCPDCKGDKA